MAKQLWFGNGTKFQWVPAPLAGAEASNVGFVEQIAYENGGGDVRRSQPYRKVYNFEFNAPIKGSEGLSVFNKFASGFYGDGLIYFADPYAFETNLFPAHWASPGLIESGWPNIYDVEPTFADTATNVYDQPLRTAAFSITTAANTAPSNSASIVTIPIPPTHRLHIGASYATSGTGVVFVRPINPDGSYDPLYALATLSPTGNTRLNYVLSGADYVAVEVFLGRTSSATSTVTLTSMMAQLWPIGVSPTLTGDHVPGEGHTGLMFADDARVETYVYINPPRKALATTLTEVGAWR